MRKCVQLFPNSKYVGGATGLGGWPICNCITISMDVVLSIFVFFVSVFVYRIVHIAQCTLFMSIFGSIQLSHVFRYWYFNVWENIRWLGFPLTMNAVCGSSPEDSSWLQMSPLVGFALVHMIADRIIPCKWHDTANVSLLKSISDFHFYRKGEHIHCMNVSGNDHQNS